MPEIDTGNTAWVLVSTALVLFMVPGLAFFYAGMVRSKNALGMLMQNFFSLGLVSVLWVILGFSLAFGEDVGGGLVGALDHVGLANLAEIPGFGDGALSIPPMAFVAFQMMFAVITPALITGATADRLKFSAWVLFLGIWSIIVYPVVAHWVFSPGGWLFQRGALDFAGGTVVHINAGIAALALIVVLGKRKGWPGEAMPPHSLPLTLLGTGILWFGWFGFNAGSALGANAVAAQALMNTHIAAAAAMCGWLVVERLKGGHATTLGAASGAVAGLVAITPCAGFVGIWGSLLIGVIAGAVCFLAIQLKFRLGYDDSLDVIAVHLVGGIIGSVLLGLLADSSVNEAAPDGLLLGGGTGLLVNQLIAVGATLAFSGIISLVLAKVLDISIGLRIDDDQEAQGLDLSQHAESAYSLGDIRSMGKVA